METPGILSLRGRGKVGQWIHQIRAGKPHMSFTSPQKFKRPIHPGNLKSVARGNGGGDVEGEGQARNCNQGSGPRWQQGP